VSIRRQEFPPGSPRWAHAVDDLRGSTARAVCRICRAEQVFWRCLADYDLVAGAYEMLAADYNWMFDDDELAHGRAISLPAAARLLQRISRTSVVLDAACGAFDADTPGPSYAATGGPLAG
jgi:hypothetical protein